MSSRPIPSWLSSLTAVRELAVCRGGVALLAASLLSACSASVDQVGPDDPEEPQVEAPVYADCGNTPNYADELGFYPEDPLPRWYSFPLRVNVDLSDAPPGWAPQRLADVEASIRAGLSIWEQAGGGIGEIIFVSSALNADITVVLDYISSRGRTGPRISGGYFTSADITIGIDFIERYDVPADLIREVTETSTHEMGHALFAAGSPGEDHSSDPFDIMASPRDGGRTPGLTDADVNTIREAYCIP